MCSPLLVVRRDAHTNTADTALTPQSEVIEAPKSSRVTAPDGKSGMNWSVPNSIAVHRDDLDAGTLSDTLPSNTLPSNTAL
jgi:hypothetical protein